MENLLREYMDRAFAGPETDMLSGLRPVVTISREFGCPSKLIAHLLTKELNWLDGPGKQKKWRFVNKEVVEATAKRLELDPTVANHLLSSGGKGLIEDVLASFAEHYVSNHRMRKTITSVVDTIANQGFVVITGMGGAAILKNHPNAVHIRLQAPREWRIKSICQAGNLESAEAARLLDEMDNRRNTFVEMLTGEKFHPYLFNVAFNCSALSNEDISGAIIGLMKRKNMI